MCSVPFFSSLHLSVDNFCLFSLPGFNARPCVPPGISPSHIARRTGGGRAARRPLPTQVRKEGLRRLHLETSFAYCVDPLISAVREDGEHEPVVLSLISPCAGAHFRDSSLAWRPIASPRLRLSGAKAYVRCPSSLHPCLVAFRSVHHPQRPRSSMVLSRLRLSCVKVPVPKLRAGSCVRSSCHPQLAREASIPDPI